MSCQGLILPLLVYVSGPPSALSADVFRRSSKSEVETATYVTRMRGCVGGALSDGRPYPDKRFLSLFRLI